MDLVDEGMCFICGQNNPIGLKVEFEVDKEKLQISGTFTPKREHEGYKGIMHGGLASALLDEAMVKLLWEVGIPAVSASIEVRLGKPVEVGRALVIKGWIDSLRGRIIFTGARLEDPSGTVLAEATGKCVRVSSKEETSVKSNPKKACDGTF